MENFTIGNVTEMSAANVLVGNNDLILRKVFNLLNAEDLKICRQVCTKWLDVSQPIFNKSSIIKLHYDQNHRNKGSTHAFLSEFKDTPLSNTFDGITIEFQDFFLFEWSPKDPIMKFLNTYGNQLKYIKLQVIQGTAIQFEFFAMKKILSELAPHLEHLCVEVEIGDGGMSSSGADRPLLEKHAGIQLHNLKKLEWSVIYEDWFDEIGFIPKQYHKNLFAPILRDLINSSPNLNSILTEGSLLNSKAFDCDNLKEGVISGLKEILICPKGSPHSVAHCLNKLTTLGEKNLQLSSASVKTDKQQERYYDDEDNNEKDVYVSLMNFINTQRNSLQKLELQCGEVDIFDDLELFTLADVPELQTMSKLKLLNVDVSGIRFLCRNYKDIWDRFFPCLKVLYLAYSEEEIESEPFIPLFLQNIEESDTLQFLRLNQLSSSEVSDSDSDCSEEDLFSRIGAIYYAAVAKFPNMQTFQLYQTKDKLIHTFRGSEENYTCLSITS